MENNPILMEGFLPRIFHGLVEHIGVYLGIAFLLLLIGFFRKRLINLTSWFVHVKVHGNWTTTLGVDDSPPCPRAHEYITLHQFFYKVWGQARVNNESHDIYLLRGQIVGEKLTLTFRDKKGFDSGAVLLKVLSTKLMRGYEVGVDPGGNIYSKVYVWTHEPDRFDTPSAAH